MTKEEIVKELTEEQKKIYESMDDKIKADFESSYKVSKELACNVLDTFGASQELIDKVTEKFKEIKNVLTGSKYDNVIRVLGISVISQLRCSDNNVVTIATGTKSVLKENVFSLMETLVTEAK